MMIVALQSHVPHAVSNHRYSLFCLLIKLISVYKLGVDSARQNMNFLYIAGYFLLQKKRMLSDLNKLKFTINRVTPYFTNAWLSPKNVEQKDLIIWSDKGCHSVNFIIF